MKNQPTLRHFFAACAVLPSLLNSCPAFAATSQLNIEGFASCLAQEEPVFSVPVTKKKYKINRTSLNTLLPYLAFYPGQRYPLFNAVNQKRGFALWETRFAEQGAKLASALAEQPAHSSLVPSKLFEMALTACGDRDVFCAAIASHNVLRTLGRHQKAIYKDKVTGEVTDFNPEWFKNNRDFWLKKIPVLKRSMIALRKVPNTDQFGEWYHFFGIYTYVLASDTAKGNTNNANAIVSLNKLATKLINGHDEDPIKAQVDQDSVGVSKLYINKKSSALPLDCSQVSAYVSQ